MMSGMSGPAAQKPKVQSEASESTTAKESRAAKVLRSATVARLPRYFSQLELDDSQRDRIRQVQSEFTDKIGQLRKQIEAMEMERDRELESVLKTDQKRKLKELKAAVVKSVAQGS
jgi:hypothetical protein